jgi:hypothetical protein
MIFLNHFVDSKIQDYTIQCSKPDVPLFYGGYYAVFAPKSKGGFWSKYWFATTKGKTIQSAAKVLPIAEAHKLWNDYLNRTL